MFQRALTKSSYEKKCYRNGLLMCIVVHETCHQK